MRKIKKEIIAFIIFAGIVSGLVLFHAPESTIPEAVSSVPSITIANTVYYFSALYSEPVLPDDSVLIETVNGSGDHVNGNTITTHGVEAGTEIYYSTSHPGWVFSLKENNLRRFAVWELSCPMIRYNGEIYLSVEYFRSCGDAEKYGPINPSRFTEKYTAVGRLSFGEYDTVPLQDLETNTELYQDTILYSANEDDSTVYVELIDSNGSIWYQAFYKASNIPLDYSVYIESKYN